MQIYFSNCNSTADLATTVCILCLLKYEYRKYYNNNGYPREKLHSNAFNSLLDPQHLEECVTHRRNWIPPCSGEAPAVPQALAMPPSGRTQPPQLPAAGTSFPIHTRETEARTTA